MAAGPGGGSPAFSHSPPIFAAALVTVSHVYSAQGEPPRMQTEARSGQRSPPEQAGQTRPLAAPRWGPRGRGTLVFVSWLPAVRLLLNVTEVRRTFSPQPVLLGFQRLSWETLDLPSRTVSWGMFPPLGANSSSQHPPWLRGP